MTPVKTTGWIYFGWVGLVACGPEATTAADDQPWDQAPQPFYYESGATWDHTNLSVCWATVDGGTAGTGGGGPDELERTWVRQAVEAAFEPVTELDFTGWEPCNASGADIAIHHDAVNWPSSGVGAREPSAAPSVWLNHFIGAPRDLGAGPEADFIECWTETPESSEPYVGVTGGTWTSRHRYCVETIAVREFLRALAAHPEHDRSDAPSWCVAAASNTSTTSTTTNHTLYGYWDLTSASNGCNPAWNNDASLSQLDTSGLNFLYGWKTNDGVWYGVGNVRDYGGSDWDQLLFDQHVHNHTKTYEIAVGNFDGDDTDDVLMYREGSGSDYVLFGRSARGFDQVTYSVTNAYDPVAGDFDGDGEDDIFWYAPGSAADKLWFGRTDRSFDNTTPTNITVTYTKVMAGDFDADGKDDLFFYAAGSTADKVLFGRSDRSFDTVTPSNVNHTYEPFTGDFDGDTKDDIFWYRPGSGSDSIWFGNSTRTFTSASITINGTYTPTAGDFDGSGTSDVLWNETGEEDRVSLFETTRGEHTNTHTSWIVGDASTGAESAPYAGDFDGDGFADVFWYKAD